MRNILVLVHGPPRPTDLNFVPRAYGRYAGGASPLEEQRVVVAVDPTHAFRLRASSWFGRGWHRRTLARCVRLS